MPKDERHSSELKWHAGELAGAISWAIVDTCFPAAALLSPVRSLSNLDVHLGRLMSTQLTGDIHGCESWIPDI
jgi:hypothetical protein